MGVMDYIEIIMKILGGMGAFLIGMSSLSENLTRLAHGKMRNMLNKPPKTVLRVSESVRALRLLPKALHSPRLWWSVSSMRAS